MPDDPGEPEHRTAGVRRRLPSAAPRWREHPRRSRGRSAARARRATDAARAARDRGRGGRPRCPWPTARRWPESASSRARARAAPRPPTRCANERKNSPTTPVSRPSGAKTTTVVRVEPATGPKISSVPCRMTSAGGSVRMECEPPLDILDHHDGIVDDDSDGDRESAEAHQVERVAREGEAEQRDGDGERAATAPRRAWCATRRGRGAGPAPRARRRAAWRRARSCIESRTSAAWSYTDWSTDAGRQQRCGSSPSSPGPRPAAGAYCRSAGGRC